MSKITLDQGLKAKLNGLNEPMELCDESGRTMGHFLPAAVYEKLVYAAAEAACPYTPEQLEQFKKEPGAKSLAEVWKSLGQV